MAREVALGDVEEVLVELSYPLSRDEAAGELEGVTLRLADGDEDLGEVVWMVGRETFGSAADLRDEIHSYLPVERVAAEDG